MDSCYIEGATTWRPLPEGTRNQNGKHPTSLTLPLRTAFYIKAVAPCQGTAEVAYRRLYFLQWLKLNV